MSSVWEEIEQIKKQLVELIKELKDLKYSLRHDSKEYLAQKGTREGL